MKYVPELSHHPPCRDTHPGQPRTPRRSEGTEPRGSEKVGCNKKNRWNNPGLCSKAVSSGGVRRLWATGSSPPPGQGFAARTVRGCLPASLHGKVLVMGRGAAGTRHRRQSVPEGQRHRVISEPWTRPAPIPRVEEQRQPGTGRRAGQSPTSS